MYPTASLKRRFAALIYEMLLIGGVSAAVGILIGIINTIISRTIPVLIPIIPILTMILFLVSWWLYFSLNWQREQQTLAMRVWKIILLDNQGQLPTRHHLRLRFIWASIFIVFVPLFAYAIAHYMINLPPKTSTILALFWWILPWGFAFIHPRQQFLYDFLAGTELINWQNNKKS